MAERTSTIVHSGYGALVELVRSGRATSRTDLATVTGLSATTVSSRVNELIEAGILSYGSYGPSRGGRRPRMLITGRDGDIVAAVDLGTRHATIGVFSLQATELVADVTIEIDISEGPDTVLQRCLDALEELIVERTLVRASLRGIGVSVPGPVELATGRVTSPSRMPGWNNADVAGILSRAAGVPVVVDNDANLMALGEPLTAREDAVNLVFLKAGSSIGCGIISGGRLYRGFHGMAGDISHVTIPDAPPVQCQCGRSGCLDAVAGGTAIMRDLHAAGIEVANTLELQQLGMDSHLAAAKLLRQAGVRVGKVLSTIVNFFNPEYVVLGGSLSRTDGFVSGVQSSIYAECLPLMTNGLKIRVSEAGQLGGVRGAAQVVLDHLYSPDVVDGMLPGVTAHAAG